MKSMISKKLLAGIMLTAFVVTNSVSCAFALGEYRPAIRSAAGVSALDVDSDVQIGNANSIVNLSLREADITQVLRMFADQAGMNIIFTPSVSGTVTMDLVNITLLKAFELVINTNNLSYDIQENTLIIGSSSDDLKANAPKNMVLIPVKYVSASTLATFLNNSIFTGDKNKPGVSSKPVVSVNPAGNELIVMGTKSDALLAQKIVEQFDKKPTITTFKVNHVTPAEMADLICSTLIPSVMSDGSSTGGAASIEGTPTGFASAPSSGGGGGGGGEGISVGGGKMVCSIDQNVSAENLESLSFKNLTVSYFPTLGTIQIIGGSETQIETIREYIAETDKKSPQAYLEVQIVTLSESGRKSFDNTWQFRSKNFSFNASGAGGFQTPPTLPIFFAGRGFSEITSSEGGGSENQTYTKWADSTQLKYTVNYIVENSKGRVLANPRILLTSGQESTIDLTSDYVAKVTSQYLDGTGAGSSQVQKDYDIQNDNGIKVSITPFISPDGYVVLDISPEFSAIAERLYTASEVAGAQDLAATLLQRRNLELKGVRIKDGETLVIGGLIQETESKTVNKIPFLGDLPIIGMFFRSTGVEKSKEEMIIMLTPQILVDSEDAVTQSTTTQDIAL